jgi:hypothetical protein
MRRTAKEGTIKIKTGMDLMSKNNQEKIQPKKLIPDPGLELEEDFTPFCAMLLLDFIDFFNAL